MTCCPPTILFHIHLLFIIHLAHFMVVEEMISKYYTSDDRLRIINIPFNVMHNEALKEWNTSASKLVASLSGYSHVIVFITTHSNPNSRDLWIG